VSRANGTGRSSFRGLFVSIDGDGATKREGSLRRAKRRSLADGSQGGQCHVVSDSAEIGGI
jgi:hypothetical protein